MKHVYQLLARGRMACFESVHEIRSSTVFLTEEAAIKRLDKFRKLVIEPGIMTLADDESLSVKVVSLEIVED